MEEKLLQAAKNGNIQQIQNILKSDEKIINCTDEIDRTPLYLACENGHLDIVKLLLLQPGIEINGKTDARRIRERDERRRRRQRDLAERDLAERDLRLILERLLERLIRDAGATPLIVASQNGHTEIVKLLLSQPGIDISCQNAAGKTALDCAKEGNHLEIVRLLSDDIIQTKQSISKSELNSMISELEALKSTISDLKKTNSELENTNSQLSKANAELEKTVSKFQNENDQLKSFLFAFKEKPTNLESVHFNDYEEGPVIGKGAQSTVKTISKKEEYAKKELRQFDHKSLQRFLNESEILVQLRHPCIVRIMGFDYGDSSHPPSIFLSLEPSSLESSIEKHELTNEDKNRITVEIVLGMRYIHSNNLMHRDLKPANILLSKNNHVRISDFGLTKEESIEISQSKGVGTLRFMAPELFEDEVSNPDGYDSKVDVYSFGIILIYILTEKYPKNYIKILNGILPELPSIAPWVVALIHQCLDTSPNNRPTFNEIFEILKSHDFDLFEETKPTKPTIQQRQSKAKIEHRVLKIEAFEYQHRL